MEEIISFTDRNSKVEVEVMYSVSEQELYIIIVLEKENNTVRIFLNKPDGEFDSENNEEIANYYFNTLEIAKLFFDKIKTMSAIQLLIFNHEGKRI